MKEKLKNLQEFYKKIPFKKTITTIIILFIIYFLLIYFAKKIETLSTFPGVRINTQDMIGKISTKLDFEEINIDDGKGNIINGLFIDNKAQKTIYYFHGNGGPLPYFYSKLKYYSDLGYNVMAYDYPGYGKSGGFPYEENVINASELFWKHLKKEKKLSEENLIVGAHSIGTAVSIQFVNNHKNISKLFLISPLASRYDMSKHFIGIPLQKFLFLKNSFVSEDLVKNFKTPVLIIHGTNDRIVPFWQGKKVFKNYAGEKNFIEIPKFGHNFIINIYGESLKNTFIKFLKGEKLAFPNNYLILDGDTKEKLEKETKISDMLNNLDLENDSSLQKFISAEISFLEKSYIPKNLETFSSKYIIDATGGRKLRREANQALQIMGKVFYEKFGKKIVVVSAYRSYTKQLAIKAGGCPDNLCSKAGYSEHQSGLAIDFFEASSEKQFLSNPNYKLYFEWLKENAHKYGFHNTYQKGLKIDTYEIEPWHWRYLGKDFATYLKEKNITIAEYYREVEEKKSRKFEE